MSNLPKLALSDDELAEILRASEKIAILVGGQALSVWARYYQIAIPAALTAIVTRDADFIGSAEAALIVKGGLSNKGWKLEQVRAGAPSPVTAQLTLQTENGIKEIDFLGSIVGLHTDDVRKRAVPLGLPGGSGVTVLHPLDVLASRLHNLAEIPEKRDDKGVAQAELAISIAGAFLRDTLAHRMERELFNQIERIRIIVTSDAIASVCRRHALDVLSCVPLDQITSEKFKHRRWPQIQREVELNVGVRAPRGRQGWSF
ncbi:MAG: hypothetical protein ACRETB_01955 [Steroidobacteraceae bacterium]